MYKQAVTRRAISAFHSMREAAMCHNNLEIEAMNFFDLLAIIEEALGGREFFQALAETDDDPIDIIEPDEDEPW